jgi:hypothetical protein
MTITIEPDVIPLTRPDEDHDGYDPEDHEFPDQQDYPAPDWKP